MKINEKYLTTKYTFYDGYKQFYAEIPVLAIIIDSEYNDKNPLLETVLSNIKDYLINKEDGLNYIYKKSKEKELEASKDESKRIKSIYDDIQIIWIY